MYYDLNIPYGDKEGVRKEVLSMALHLGYDIIAWTHTVEGTLTSKDKVDRIKLLDVKSDAQASLLRVQASSRSPEKIKQVRRLNVNLSHPKEIHVLNNSRPILAGYDLLAIAPQNEKMFHQACNAIECDIITIDLTTRLPYHLRRNIVMQAIQRGVVFEIVYSSALRSKDARRNVLANASSLVTAAKGRNVILSSGAGSPMHLRSPYDVANLGVLFGLDTAQSQASLAKHPRAALLHGIARNSARATLSTELIRDMGKEEIAWKLADPNAGTRPAKRGRGDGDDGDGSVKKAKTEEEDFIKL